MTEFLNSEIGIAVYGMLAVTLVNFVSGVAAAARDGTFTFQAVDAFVRSHVMGRVVPVFVLLFAGYMVGETAGAALTASGLAAAAAYVTASVASVLALWAGGQVKDVPQE